MQTFLANLIKTYLDLIYECYLCMFFLRREVD